MLGPGDSRGFSGFQVYSQEMKRCQAISVHGTRDRAPIPRPRGQAESAEARPCSDFRCLKDAASLTSTGDQAIKCLQTCVHITRGTAWNVPESRHSLVERDSGPGHCSCRASPLAPCKLRNCTSQRRHAGRGQSPPSSGSGSWAGRGRSDTAEARGPRGRLRGPAPPRPRPPPAPPSTRVRACWLYDAF